ncbi:MAG: response regulator [Bacteroidales bacterium]|nr:response regulator [Bacteroidales bacterium]
MHVKQLPLNRIVFLLVALSLSLFIKAQDNIADLKAKALEHETQGDKVEAANLYNKLGKLYWDANQYNNAIESYEKSIKLNTEMGNANAQRIISGYLGLINLEKEDYNKAIQYFEKSLELNQKTGRQQEVLSDLYNIANAYQMLGRYDESNKNAQAALNKALESNNMQSAKSCNLLMAENYEKLGNSKKSAEHYANYNSIVKLLQQEQMKKLETEKNIAQVQVSQVQSKITEKEKELKSVLDTLGEVIELNREMQYQKEIKDLELKEQQARFELEKKTHQSRTRFFVFLTTSIFIILVLFFVQSRHRKNINKKLQEQNAEIEKQKIEIEKQRDLADKQRTNLTSSIQYARRIQSAVIPRPEKLTEHFSDSFIMYRPKDIVSGDFYWFVRKDNVFIIAVADCTGHGVPGAFMSMLGVAYLNEIINKIAINIHINSLNADEILNQLRDKVINSLHQSGSADAAKDGMDMALCIIDFNSKKLQFSGAYNPLIVIRDNEVVQFKGDKMPVSYHQRKDIPFSRQEFQLQKNDCLYLFSDGFIDQYGGNDKRKYLAARFTQLLLDIHKSPMAAQKQVLEDEFDTWRGENPQIDDVLVVGFRFGKHADASVTDWRDKTILIAEDTDINYYLLAEVLRTTNVKILRVKDGQEAVTLAKDNNIDLILMDINMPNMNGFEATKQIKQLNKKIPVIIQTAVFEDGLEKSIEVGADDFISKPIDLKLFMEKISNLL